MSQILYGLDCGHAAPGKASPFPEKLVCAWDHKPVKVTAIIVWEWCANCQTCSLKRFANLSKHNAEVMAAGHVGRNRDHSVLVEYVVNPTAIEAAERFLRWGLGLDNG